MACTPFQGIFRQVSTRSHSPFLDEGSGLIPQFWIGVLTNGAPPGDFQANQLLSR